MGVTSREDELVRAWWSSGLPKDPSTVHAEGGSAIGSPVLQVSGEEVPVEFQEESKSGRGSREAALSSTGGDQGLSTVGTAVEGNWSRETCAEDGGGAGLG